MSTGKLDQLLLRLLGGVPLFDGMDKRELSALLALMSKVQLSLNQSVFNEGERGDSLLVLVSGRLEVFRFGSLGEDVRLALIEPGCVVGEMSLIDNAPRSASVRALSSSMALGLAQSSLSKQPALAARVYRNLARVLAIRLRLSNDEKLASAAATTLLM